LRLHSRKSDGLKFLFALSIVFALIFELCTFALKCSAAPPAQSGAKMKVLELKQSHYFFGDLVTLASLTAIRMEDTGSWKFVLVAKAPDWKVTVFRNDDKIYFTCPLKTFADGGMVSQLLVGKKGEFIEGGNMETLSTTVGGVHVKRVSSQIASCEYVPCQTIASPQAAQILYETMRMPTNGGIALRFVQQKGGTDWMTGLKDYGQHIMLSTQSTKMITVPVSVFDTPVGYKLSKSLREVLISNESRASSTDAKDLFEIKR
jgi:hypothetical protein